MNYGQSIALRIIVANQLGGDFGYEEECKKLIINKPVMPILLKSIESESIQALNWVKDKNLIEQSKIIAEKYF